MPNQGIVIYVWVGVRCVLTKSRNKGLWLGFMSGTRYLLANHLFVSGEDWLAHTVELFFFFQNRPREQRRARLNGKRFYLRNSVLNLFVAYANEFYGLWQVD